MLTTITVSGSGGCINYEMEIIEKALRAAGLNVIVTNKFDWSDKEEKVAALSEYYLKKPNKFSVKLVADHLPWGG